MALDQQFIEAQQKVTTLSEKPSPDILLQLYSLFKQATAGDVSGKKPGMLDFVAKAKFEAWEGLKGKSKEQAMQGYIKLVEELVRNDKA
ncbi:acyl-CoA-binding protein [bacterium]|nr:acyl-CoA-binding protein [bacterium]